MRKHHSQSDEDYIRDLIEGYTFTKVNNRVLGHKKELYNPEDEAFDWLWTFHIEQRKNGVFFGRHDGLPEAENTDNMSDLSRREAELVMLAAFPLTLD